MHCKLMFLALLTLLNFWICFVRHFCWLFSTFLPGNGELERWNRFWLSFHEDFFRPWLLGTELSNQLQYAIFKIAEELKFTAIFHRKQICFQTIAAAARFCCLLREVCRPSSRPRCGARNFKNYILENPQKRRRVSCCCSNIHENCILNCFHSVKCVKWLE